MDVEELNPDQEIDFCTLGMFILGKLLCLFSVYPPRRQLHRYRCDVCTSIYYTTRVHIYPVDI
mgnify:FL=1